MRLAACVSTGLCARAHELSKQKSVLRDFCHMAEPMRRLAACLSTRFCVGALGGLLRAYPRDCTCARKGVSNAVLHRLSTPTKCSVYYCTPCPYVVDGCHGGLDVEVGLWRRGRREQRQSGLQNQLALALHRLPVKRLLWKRTRVHSIVAQRGRVYGLG